MRIDDWAVITPIDPYVAPETQTQCLNGRVFGHPRFDDGHFVTTSSICGKNNKGEVVTSSGSAYELGPINTSYEVAFPGARERLLDSLPIVE